MEVASELVRGREWKNSEVYESRKKLKYRHFYTKIQPLLTERFAHVFLNMHYIYCCSMINLTKNTVMQIQAPRKNWERGKINKTLTWEENE